MCVVSLPAPVTGLRIAPLGEDVGVAALPEPHPLSRESELDPRRIADSPLLLLPRVANSAFHDSVKLVRRVEQLAGQAEARALTVHGSRVRETSKA